MFHVGFLSQEYEVDEWIHGNSLAHPRTTHSMYHIEVHIHTDSAAVAPSSHEQPTVAFSDTSYRGASSHQNVPDPVCDPQQPIPPKPVYGYIYVHKRAGTSDILTSIYTTGLLFFELTFAGTV